MTTDDETLQDPKQAAGGGPGHVPTRRRLVSVEGRHQTPYDLPGELPLHEGEHFTARALGLTLPR